MSRSKRSDTEIDIINNSKSNHLYNHEFEKGRFFQVVYENEEGFEIKLASKTMFKAKYISDKDDIDGIEIIKVIEGQEKQKVILSKFNFQQLRTFLQFLDDIDLKGISEKRIRLAEEEELNSNNIKSLKTLLAKDGGADIVEDLINEGIITSHDIVNTAFRKRGLLIFENLLKNKDYWVEYAKENSISCAKEEKVWQYFFEKNIWIFGYGLDYRFQQLLQREGQISDSDLDGKNTVVTDFLMGDQRFTTFVELKKPSTDLFRTTQNRSKSWRLSTELQDSVSQILEQKASGIDKLSKPQYTDSGDLIPQKSYDSKVILIIGNWNELDVSNNIRERDIKMKTLELYRRDSRNIEIITFDELYERAKFIVEDKQNEISSLEDDFEDLPF